MLPGKGASIHWFLSLVKRMRLLNCLIAAFGVFIGFAIASNGIFFSLIALLAMLSVFFICGAGQIINDFFDKEVDARKGKAIENHDSLLFFSVFLFALGIIFSFLINFTALLIAIIVSFLLIAYSGFFQKAKFFGNWVVAVSSGMTLLFGAAVAGNSLIVFPFFACAVFSSVGREIAKDFVDLNLDKGKKFSLPMFSRKLAVIIAIVLTLIAIVVSFIPFFAFRFGNSIHFALLVVVGIIFLETISLLIKNNFKKAIDYYKIGMLFSLIAFLSGVF